MARAQCKWRRISDSRLSHDRQGVVCPPKRLGAPLTPRCQDGPPPMLHWAKQTLAMKALSLLLFLCASLGWTQSAPPASGEKPDTVVAIFDDGTKMTQGELETLISVMPDNFRSLALHDPQRFLHVYGTMLRAAAAFKSQKLEDKTPYKQGLDFALLSTMTDLYIRDSTAAITVSPRRLRNTTTSTKSPSNGSK